MSINRLARYYVYFRRGHSGYLALFVALANFIIIQYRLLIQYIPQLQALFQSLTVFLIAFVLTYFPLTIIVGWLDYKKLIYPREASILAESNPYFKKPMLKEQILWGYVFQAINRILEKQGIPPPPEKEKVENCSGRLWRCGGFLILKNRRGN